MIQSQVFPPLTRKKKQAPAAPPASVMSFLHCRPRHQSLSPAGGSKLSRPRTGRHGKTRAPLPPGQIQMNFDKTNYQKPINVNSQLKAASQASKFSFDSEPRTCVSASARTRGSSLSLPSIAPPPPPPPPTPPPPPPLTTSTTRLTLPQAGVGRGHSDPREELMKAIRHCGGVRGLGPANTS